LTKWSDPAPINKVHRNVWQSRDNNSRTEHYGILFHHKIHSKNSKLSIVVVESDDSQELYKTTVSLDKLPLKPPLQSPGTIRANARPIFGLQLNLLTALMFSSVVNFYELTRFEF